MSDASARRYPAQDCANQNVGSGAPTQSGVYSLSPVGNAVFGPIVMATPAKLVRRLGTGCHWWFSEGIHIPVGSDIEFRFQGAAHLLVLYNEGGRKNGETSIDGLHSSRLRSIANKITFVPAGQCYREWHETDSATHMTFLYLNPAAFQKPAASECALRPRIHFEDSLVWETASKLRNAIESGQVKSIAYLEAVSAVLGHELCGVGQTVMPQPKLTRGGLASWQKRVVVDHIERHLGEQVGLPTLAQLAELSLHHFCRAFKQSFGVPPHQYQVQRRMEVAKLLLADRTTSVTDIALQLGYAQISSFTFAFRKATGWTPMVYRREFKGPDAITYATPANAGLPFAHQQV
jgi:AraC family transcriptional regulator